MQNRPKAKDINPKWDSLVPVEKSAYIVDDDEPVVIRANQSIEKDAFILVDLFSGCGGFSVGFKKAGFVSLLAIDHLKPACETYAYNHPETNVILGDIRKVTPELIRELIGSRHVHVLTAGVPCQGFSLMNRKHNDDDERNFLFREFIRLVQIINPDIVVLENVAGLRMRANGEFERSIKKAIGDSGYYVCFNTLNAADYGVPQIRERVFFIGTKSTRVFRWPKPTNGKGLMPYVTVDEAIGDLPPVEIGQQEKNYKRAPYTDYQKMMREDCDVLLNHEAPNHAMEVVEMIKSTPPGEPMYKNFRQRIRLHPDKPSPTQVSGGIRPQFQFGHPNQARGLTIRERCRIQSFPDKFLVLGGIVQGRVQTGNAVPPLLAFAVARSIMEYIVHVNEHQEDEKYSADETRTTSNLPRQEGYSGDSAEASQMELF